MRFKCEGGSEECPQNFIFNMVQFGVFWCIFGSNFVYKKISEIIIFYIKLEKKYVKIHISYSCTHMLGSLGAYSNCSEKILKMW